MRKAICIILMLTYAAMSCGVTVHYNYCRGRLTGVSLLSEAECSVCAKKKKCCGRCPCCEKVVKVFRVEMDQTAADAPESAGQPVTTDIPYMIREHISTAVSSPVWSAIPYCCDPPPDIAGMAICIRHCSFLI